MPVTKISLALFCATLMAGVAAAFQPSLFGGRDALTVIATYSVTLMVALAGVAMWSGALYALPLRKQKPRLLNLFTVLALLLAGFAVLITAIEILLVGPHNLPTQPHEPSLLAIAAIGLAMASGTLAYLSLIIGHLLPARRDTVAVHRPEPPVRARVLNLP